MPKLPVIKGKELITFLESIGFVVTRTKGSHVRMHSEDGRATTVPLHGNQDISQRTSKKNNPRGFRT